MTPFPHPEQGDLFLAGVYGGAHHAPGLPSWGVVMTFHHSALKKGPEEVFLLNHPR
ncbi:MAG: hypothetical protein JXB10_05220 [Pirellulales bacterium]|nr:hypothetical protein [Pirellulales bacterium]